MEYLLMERGTAPANSRSTARQKLTRLTKQQFQELSTDVYDELVRRKKNSSENEGPSLSFPFILISYATQSRSCPFETTSIQSGIKLVRS
jgi:hypothetical protein